MTHAPYIFSLTQDENWEEEDKLKEDEFAYLSDMIGPKGAITLDNDDVVTEMFDNDELRRDPVYSMDMQVSDFGSVIHYWMLM